MKKIISLILVAFTLVLVCASCGTKPAEQKTVAYVSFGAGDFFDSLEAAYKKTFTDAGFNALATCGEFNPAKQIEACENYISMGVDVLLVHSVAPESMPTVFKKARAAGVKVVAFVGDPKDTSSYDVLMESPDEEMASNLALMCATWIDKTFADAPDHSVPVVVPACKAATTGVLQAAELVKIESLSKKAKFVKEIEVAEESLAAGQTTAENLYAEDSSIQVVLTAHSAIAEGFNAYYTSASFAGKDNLSNMGIFCINGNTSTAALIKDANSPMRAMVLTGSVQDTANEMLMCVKGALDGSMEAGYVQKATCLYVTEATAQEYIDTGKTSLTKADITK